MNLVRFFFLGLLLTMITQLTAELFPPVQCGNDPQTVCRSLCFEELAYCPPPDVPRSFLWTRPVYRNIASQDAGLWHDALNNYSTPQCFAAQAIGFYQKSIATRGINTFFLFDDKQNLSVKGDNVIDGNSNLRDVRAEWLQLQSNFIGSCRTKPVQSQIGFWLETKLDLSALFCHDFFERMWIGLAVPFQIVKNNVQLRQTVASTPDPNFPNGLIGALNNPSFVYAKFGPAQNASGASELNFRLGTKLLDRDGFQIGFYSLFLLPLHTHAHPEFVFSPIMGNNRHFGAGSGLMFQLPINYPCDTLFSFVFEAESIYFFRNDQRRTFDLKKKPWSRYMLYNKVNGLSNIPGAHVLTRKVQIKPYNMIEAVGALRIDINSFQGEFGYHVWARGRETMKFIKPFPEKYGIAGTGVLIPGTNVQATASRSTIAHQSSNDINVLTGDPIFVTIKENDVELHTGASPAQISHMIYATLGWAAQWAEGDWMLNLGVYGEIPQYPTSMATWGLWGKLGLYL